MGVFAVTVEYNALSLAKHGTFYPTDCIHTDDAVRFENAVFRPRVDDKSDTVLPYGIMACNRYRIHYKCGVECLREGDEFVTRQDIAVLVCALIDGVNIGIYHLACTGTGELKEETCCGKCAVMHFCTETYRYQVFGVGGRNGEQQSIT